MYFFFFIFLIKKLLEDKKEMLICLIVISKAVSFKALIRLQDFNCLLEMEILTLLLMRAVFPMLDLEWYIISLNLSACNS